jgi:molecular chaperone GrpE (heat shock protein)
MAKDSLDKEDKIVEEESSNQTDNVDKNNGQETSDTQSILEEKEILENELKFAKLEIEDWKNRTARLAADLQNISKQHELDIQHAKKSAKKSTLSTIITFINTLNLAFSFAPQTQDEAVLQFITTLKSSLDRAIEDYKNIGVDIIIPKSGEVFNPEYMNILNPDVVGDSNEVLVKQVVSCGLKIDNQLVQPANVMV